MSSITIPIERFVFGNEHWRSSRAIDEIRIYCDLLGVLDDRIDGLATRGENEEANLVNVQAVISSYAMEIGIKSLWALDHPTEPVPRNHDLLSRFDELDQDTIQSLDALGLKRKSLENSPVPFMAYRYSMETASRNIEVYRRDFLEQLAQLIDDKAEETSKRLLSGPQAPGT